jgi:hypothetical protein
MVQLVILGTTRTVPLFFLAVACALAGPSRQLFRSENTVRLKPGQSVPLRTEPSARLTATDPKHQPKSAVFPKPEPGNIGVYQDSDGFFVAVSPLTPPGTYTVVVSAFDGAGGYERNGALTIQVEPTQAASEPVVLLLNGLSIPCSAA